MSEQLVQTEFQIMLKAFNQMVDNMPPIPQVKGELLELKEAAKLSTELNYRQREAITARVDNYLNGTYGKNSKKEQYAANQ